MNDLNRCSVYRDLNNKVTLMGFELFDLIALATFSSVMNLFFGRTFLALPLVFLLPGVLACILYWIKKNRPPGFLEHCIQYLAMADVIRANQESKRIKLGDL